MRFEPKRNFTLHGRIFYEGSTYEAEQRSHLALAIIDLEKRDFCTILKKKSGGSKASSKTTSETPAGETPSRTDSSEEPSA